VAYEVAEAVRRALLENDFSGAINAPAVGGELVQRLQPVMALATRLGQLAHALAASLEAVEIRYAGSAAEEALRPLTAAALVGVLQNVVGAEGVNLVSALHLAEARGLHIRRVLLESMPEHAEYLELRISGGARETRVAGALRGTHPRLVRVDAFPVDIRPAGTLLLLRNRDVPGVIGRVGSLLGEADVNIAEYHQSRLEAGGEALAAVAIDDRLPTDLLDELRSLADVLEAHQVDLG
jgi:D-3-phosphoglycerate dehydrogenase